MEQKIKKFIGDRAVYLPDAQTILREKGEGDKAVQNMFLDVRGWGAIQNMGFNTQKEAEDFQDAVGEWVADAINQKLKNC